MAEESPQKEVIFPHKAYRFRVSFFVEGEEVEAYFQSVGGLSGSYTAESYPEGGIAGYQHQLTSRASFGPLTLKRGMTRDRQLYDWCEEVFLTMHTVPRDVLVSLFDEQQEVVDSWLILHAIPTNWSASDLSADSSAIVIESMQMSYQHFIRI